MHKDIIVYTVEYFVSWIYKEYFLRACIINIWHYFKVKMVIEYCILTYIDKIG